MISGILNLDKPAGWTSFDVVGFVRGRCGERHVGHAGTLDPAATGVLPLCLGRATRMVEYLVDATKTYVADVELGVVTDTYDADGRVLGRTDAAGVERSRVAEALQAFVGEIEQRPPPYSAIKRAGVPLYRLARAGAAVETQPRRVLVQRIALLDYAPPRLRLEVECGKGTYIRSLAHDLGAALGVGGSLAGLVRTRVGTFRLADAVDIDTLRVELEDGSWRQRLWAPDEVLLAWDAAILDADSSRRLSHGGALTLDAAANAGARCRAYSGDGDFLATLRYADGAWRPDKVFAPAGAAP